MLKFWFILKYLLSQKNFFHFTSLLSILGLAIGIASLVVSMAVFSGYESTLKKSIFSKQGHLFILKERSNSYTKKENEKLLKKSIPELKNLAAFLQLDALLVHKKKNSGVTLYGIDTQQRDKVLDLRKKLVAGKFELKSEKHVSKPGVLIGKALANKYQLHPGEDFKMIFVQSDSKFSPKMKSFQVKGILDYGRYDYNERMVILSLLETQKIQGPSESDITGFYAQIQDENKAFHVAGKINQEFPSLYWAKDWSQSHQNLFEVIKLEKAVIFIILLLMVLAAGVNVSCTLTVSVIERFREISLLKTIGAKNSFILQIFSLQGLIIGIFGLLMGIGMGLFVCHSFLYAQEHWNILVGDVYTLEKIDLEIRFTDLFLIAITSLFVCLLASVFPAYKGMKRPPSEGFRYE